MQDLFNLHFMHEHVLLGRVKGSGAPVWYPIDEMTLHMLLLARTGLGKTNFIYWVTPQIFDRVPCWFFDKKEDYRHLLRVFPDKLFVVNIMENFACNPLVPPPYVPLRRWLGYFGDFFPRSNNLLDGSTGLLIETLDELYEKYGSYEETDSPIYPSFYDLKEALDSLNVKGRSRKAQYRESLLNRFGAYTRMTPGVYDCSIGFDLEEFLNKSGVFELGGMPKTQANFWINYLLYWIFAYRIAKKERGNKLLNLVVFDEAKSVFSPFDKPALGFEPIVDMVSMVREFGVGIIAADNVAKLNDVIFANTQLKLLFGMGSGEDLLKAKRAMGLSNEQAEYVHRLKVGEAIVRYPKIPEPFVLEIPKVPLE